MLTIMDIGAADGVKNEWDEIQNMTELKMVLFEPDDRSYDELISDNKKNTKIYNAALGAKNESVNIYLTRKPQCSSLLLPNRNYLDRFPNKERWDIVKTVKVKVKPLDEFKNLIGNVDFIKLDTQGSELDIIKGGDLVLDDCLGLEVEVEFLEVYQDQPLFGEVSRHLSNKGFEFFDFITEYRYGRQKLNRKGQLAFADALFLRNPEYILSTYKEEPTKIMNYIYICKIYNKVDLIEYVHDNVDIENVKEIARKLLDK